MTRLLPLARFRSLRWRYPTASPLSSSVAALLPLFCATFASFIASAAPIPIAEPQRSSPVDFQREILPLLKSNCLACHSQSKSKAGLILETPQSILKGGDSGPAAVPGNAAESLLFLAASHQSDSPMPPKNNQVAAANFTPDELGLLKLWIDQGARGELTAPAPISWKPLPPGFNPIYAAAVTSDGQFAACGRGNQIFIYHLPSSTEIGCLEDPQLSGNPIYAGQTVAHRDLVHALAFNPAGNLLASGDYRQIKLWRYLNPQELFRLPLSFSATGSLAISSNARWLAWTDHTQIAIFDLKENRHLKTFELHQNPAAVQFSPDQPLLAAAGRQGALSIWHIPSGELRAQHAHSSPITTLAWGNHGTNLLTGSPDGHLHLFDTTSNAPSKVNLLRSWKAHDTAITALAIPAHASTEAITAGEDGLIRHWRLSSTNLIREFSHGAPILALALRPDGKRVASSGQSNPVKLWNLENGKLIAELKGNRHANRKVTLAEQLLAFSNSEIDFCKSNLESARKEQTAEEDRLKKATETSAAAEKTFSEKQMLLTTASQAKTAADKLLSEFQSELEKSKAAFEQAEKAAQEAQQSAKKALHVLENQSSTPTDDSKTARAQAEKTVENLAAASLALGEIKALHDKLTAEAPEREKKAKEAVDTQTKALAAAESEFKKAELAKNTASQEVQLATSALEQAKTRVASAHAALESTEAVKHRNESDLERAKSFAAAAELPTFALAFSPDNSLLATADAAGTIHTWNAETGTAYEVFSAHPSRIWGLTFTAPHQLISAASGNLIAMNIAPQWQFAGAIGSGDFNSPIEGRVNALRFSPDDAWLASGSGQPSRSGQIQIWNASNLKLWREFPTIHSDTVLSLDFSPDGKFLASGAADRFLRVTDLTSSKLVKNFEGHTHHVLGVSWKRDGRTIASAGADQTVKVWDFLTGERKKSIDGFAKEITALQYIGFTDQLLVSSGDQQVRILKDTGDKIRAFSGAGDFVHAIATTPDGDLVIAGGHDSILRLWNGKDGKSIGSFSPPQPPSPANPRASVNR